MEEIELLIEDYKRRLEYVNELIEDYDKHVNPRKLKTEKSCYLTFIAELERVKLKMKS